MKLKVTYYDTETNSYLKKHCALMEYGYLDKEFKFLPLDDPPKQYKKIHIISPQISVYQNKTSGYVHTTTIISSFE